mmetsp:Transcript_5369/g.16336  ORF Transcript_5369/g.16336 Transcript_5369/m.16336 type:complete len:218 (+) Transcript_5369:574-1227(+)
MDARLPPTMRSAPDRSAVAVFPVIVASRRASMRPLSASKTKNSTALVGAMRATLRLLPRKRATGPPCDKMRRRVPTKPSLVERLLSSMYSIFTRSIGATAERLTPPAMAPAARCLAASQPLRAGTDARRPAIGNAASASATCRQARPHAAAHSLAVLASPRSRKSRNSAKSIARPAEANPPASPADPASRPPPLENAPLPVLARRNISRVCESVARR